MNPVGRRSLGIWSRISLVHQKLRALSGDSALQGRLAEIAAKVTDVRDLSLNINHHAIEVDRAVQSVHERLDSLTGQLTAEREATMASNDGVRRQVALIAEFLGDDLLRQRAAPVLENVRDQLDRAESMMQVARSHYRDSTPQDASGFAPVEP